MITSFLFQIKLKNQSLIGAKFTASFSKENSAWSVDPPTGLIGANQSAEVNVMVHVNDSIHFEDKLLINIENGNKITIRLVFIIIPIANWSANEKRVKTFFSLSCDGIGCTVVSEPAMNPVPDNGIDLGPLFATQMDKRQFKLVNIRLKELSQC